MMRKLNKTLIALAISTSCAGFAYADTYNPFIDNSQNTANTQSPSGQTQSTLQPTQPTYNFSQRPGTIAPQPFLTSNSGPGNATNQPFNTNNALPQPMPIGPSSPQPLGPGGTQPNLGPGGSQPNLGPGGIAPNTPLGPGGTAPSAASSLLQAILNLDSDVKNTNKLGITQWNQTIQNQAQANAMLLPTNLNFLWGQTAYQNMQQLVPGSNNQQAMLQSILTSYSQNNCSSLLGGTTSQNCQQLTSPDPSNLPYNIMTAQSISQFPAGSTSGQNAVIINTSYIDNLVNTTETTAVQNSQAVQVSALGAAQYVLANIATNNQADTTDGVDSLMNILNTAVSAPLSNTPDPVTNQTWFQQLSVASEPQLLRSVAVMLALNNYLQYQNLKAAQNEQLLQSAQLVQEVRLEQTVNRFDANEQSRQQNTVGQIKTLLQNKF